MDTIKAFGRTYKRVPYDPKKHGELDAPEGFFDQLRGKSFEEQMKQYSFNGCYESSRVYAGGDVTSAGPCCYGGNIGKLPDVVGLLVNDEDIVVGIVKKSGACYPAGYTYYWESEDNNGAAYKCYSESTSLTCILLKQ